MIRFAEQNERVFTAERAMIDAEDDAAMMAENDAARELDRLQRIYDTSTALHEFILNARYERDVREGRIILR